MHGRGVSLSDVAPDLNVPVEGVERVHVVDRLAHARGVEHGLVVRDPALGLRGEAREQLAALDELEQEEAQVRILVRRVQLEQERVADLRRRRAV